MKIVVVLVAAFVAASSTVSDAQPAPPVRPHRVLVLPIDGNADPALRKRVDGSVLQLVHTIDPKATAGETTFAETATAVGCDPAKPACIDTVIATLSVDELVWGTATTTAGRTIVIVSRAEAKRPAREAAVALEAGAMPDDARTTAALGPLFGAAPPPPSVVADAPVDHRRRNIGLGCAIGGGVMAIIALALWSNASSTQSQIDAHATNTVDDFMELAALDSRVTTYAIAGDVLMLVGLALGGFGGYVLYTNRDTVTVGVGGTF